MVTLIRLPLCAALPKILAVPQAALSPLQRPEDRAQGEEAMCPNSNLGHRTRKPMFNWPGHPSLLGPLASPTLTPASWEAQFFWSGGSESPGKGKAETQGPSQGHWGHGHALVG